MTFFDLLGVYLRQVAPFFILFFQHIICAFAKKPMYCKSFLFIYYLITKILIMQTIRELTHGSIFRLPGKEKIYKKLSSSDSYTELILCSYSVLEGLKGCLKPVIKYDTLHADLAVILIKPFKPTPHLSIYDH